MKILVTDGDQRAALAVVRSLGRAGHEVWVCSSRRRCLAGASRYCLGVSVVPDPLDAPLDFAAEVERLADRDKVAVLLPITDATLLALLPVRARFRSVRIPFPSDEVFRRICDKAAVLEAAGRLGICVPTQQRLSSQKDRDSLEREMLRFPLVLKPSRSVGESDGQRKKLGVSHIADWNSLSVALDRASPAAYPILLQQRIVGPGVGVFLLLWDGEAIAVFAHRRIREKPPSGGVSVYRESIVADPGLVESSRRLLEAFNWKGVAMVEYKIDAATGTPYLMEINGRFWGSLQLAIDAGVDFPSLLVDIACDGRPRPVTTYREGVKSRWWWGDVDQLLLRLRRSAKDLALPPDSPGRWSSVREFLMTWNANSRSEILRRDDPRPFIRETLEWLKGR